MRLWKPADIDIPPPIALKVAFGIMETGCILVGLVAVAWAVTGHFQGAIVAASALCLMLGVVWSLKGGSGRMRLLPLLGGVFGIIWIFNPGISTLAEMLIFSIVQGLLVLVPALLFLPSSGHWFAQFSARMEPPRTRIGRVIDRVFTCVLFGFFGLMSLFWVLTFLGR